eukprot:TRINITY_DN1373_c0_g2_i2.p1 TRINITY_DN1373_c0_g2~~TRINITY_DN1373_c0_g2_i2.p1  ORF type:complete len:184 (-),score=1.15 TRINITY_DN1373_c0_g2_i2:46-597(-)
MSAYERSSKFFRSLYTSLMLGQRWGEYVMTLVSSNKNFSSHSGLPAASLILAHLCFSSVERFWGTLSLLLKLLLSSCMNKLPSSREKKLTASKYSCSLLSPQNALPHSIAFLFHLLALSLALGAPKPTKELSITASRSRNFTDSSLVKITSGAMKLRLSPDSHVLCVDTVSYTHLTLPTTPYV